jgi:hypothetical protein
VFLAINASLHWLNNVSCLFLSFPTNHKWSIIVLDRLAAYIALRVIGAVLVVSSVFGIKFAQSSSQWEAQANT